MQFEQFCSKDFRDTSNLILNRSKLGPITLNVINKIKLSKIFVNWSVLLYMYFVGQDHNQDLSLILMQVLTK